MTSMSMTHTPGQTAYEEPEQASPRPTRRLANPEDVRPGRPGPHCSFKPRTPARPHRSTAVWRHRKREFLRRSQRLEKRDARAAMVSFILSALSPFALLLTMITALLGAGLYYYQSQQSALERIASDF